MMCTKNDELNVVRCDIGSFVVAVQRLKALTEPLYKVYLLFSAVVRWERPLLSFFTFCVLSFIAGHNPELLGNILIIPLPLGLILGFFRKISERKPSTTTSLYTLFKRRDEPAEVLAKKAAIQRAQEHVVIYMDILIAIQLFCNDFSDKLEAFYDIFNWRKRKLSGFVFVGSLSLILLLSVLHTEQLSVLIVIAVFLCNSGFKKFSKTFLSDIFTLISSPVTSVFGLVSDNSYRESSNHMDEGELLDIVPDEFRTANNSESSDTSDNEEQVRWKKENDTQSISQTAIHKPGSVVSRLANYGRQKMKKWSGGNCMSCKVYFSTILKKRQYCRHCGYSFCSKCCHQRVPRAVFGATAPAAYEQTVLVCSSCHDFLVNRMKSKNTEIVE